MAKARGEKPHLRKRSARGYELTYRNAAGVRATETIHARTKTEARELADKFLAKVENARLGLEDAIKIISFEDAFWQYAETAAAKKSWPQEFGRWKNHILQLEMVGAEDQRREYQYPRTHWKARSRLAKELIHLVTSDSLEALYVAKQKEGLEPRTIRQLKAHLGRFFQWSIRKARLMRGENVGWLSELPCDIPEAKPKALSAPQLEALLTRGFETFETFFLLLFATYTGLRRGELAGLLWENVHEELGFVWVDKSFADTTKGKRGGNIPIHPVLRPYVREARERTTSEFVFPSREGGMHPYWWDTGDLFRTCLKRAGLIQGYVQECRPRRGARAGSENPKSKLTAEQVRAIRQKAKAGHSPTALAIAFAVSRQAILHHLRAPEFRPPGGCGYVSGLLPEEATGPCPTCGAPLLARAVPLDFTLKDLRSTFGTYVVEGTGGLRAAQLLLRHRDEKTTDTHYAQRRNPFLEAQLAQVRIVDADKLPTANGLLLPDGVRNGATRTESVSQLPDVDR